MRRHLLALVAGMGLLASLVPSPPAAATAWGDFTWGYDYQRTRQTFAINAQASLVENGVCAASDPGSPCVERFPYVVPLPGTSTGTLIAPGDNAYFVTHTSDTAWLWDLPLTASGPKQASLVRDFTLQPGESFDAPSDPSVSPEGRWLAVGVGKRLCWTRLAGGGWTCERIRSRENGAVSMVSMAPAFVPSTSGGSARYVCEGDWNGTLDCFDMSTGEPVVQYYSSQFPHPEDTAGQITSSPALLPDGRVCFGISSFVAPRVVCVAPSKGPFTPPQDDIGLGTILNPVAASTLYDAANGDLYVTDQQGNVYRLDPNSGDAVATQYATSGAGLTIVSPALDPSGGLWVGANSDTKLCRLDADSLAELFCANDGGVTSPTVATDGPGFATAWDFLTEGAIDVINTATGEETAFGIAPPGGNGFGAGTFTAAGVGIGPGNGIGAWSDQGTSAWASGDYGGTPDPLILPPPVGFSSSQTPGALQIWLTSPKLLAWAAPDPLYTGDAQSKPQTYYVYALTAVPGGSAGAGLSADTSGVASSVGVTLPNGRTVPMKLVDMGEAGQPSAPIPDAYIPWQDGQGQAATWGMLAAVYAAANGVNTPRGNRYVDGTPPQMFTGYMLWRAGPFTAPAAGYYALEVDSATSTGLRSTARPWLAAFCPDGDVATRAGCRPQTGGGPSGGNGGGGGGGGSGGTAPWPIHVHGVLVCGPHEESCVPGCDRHPADSLCNQQSVPTGETTRRGSG